MRYFISTDADCATLRSILDDGNYEIADEDRVALEAVINILTLGTAITGAELTITNTTNDNGIYTLCM